MFIENFETGKKIGKFNTLDFLNVCDIKTQKIYLAMISSIELKFYFQNEIINLIRELHICSQINHPTIPKLIGYGSISFDDFPCIIIESHSNYTLHSILFSKKNKISLDITQKLIIIYGIASCLSYLHSNNILHRDLKTSNIFFDSDLYPKVSGFHISKEITSDINQKSDFIKGTPAYLAPEIYARKEYSKASDVYAFSLVVYELMTTEKAFSNFRDIKEIVNEVAIKEFRPNIDEKVPKSYSNLIQKCWSQDPAKRPSFDQIVHMLKTDPSFITEGVDENKFKSYVEMIENSEISFDKQNKIDEYDHLVSNELDQFRSFDFSLNLTQLYETETNNLLFNWNFLDMKEFKIINKIDKQKQLTICEIAHKETKTRYLARVKTSSNQ